MEANASETAKSPRCPECGWTDVRLSRPRGMLDGLVRMIGLVPYRCRTCGLRFYRRQQNVREAAG